MRNISFSMTEPAILARTKTVTRRLGWATLKPGTLLRAVDKCMGLKPGQSPRTLATIRVVSVRREPLHFISEREVLAEGFDYMAVGEFIGLFCKHMKCAPSDEVTRIEFEYVDPAPNPTPPT